MCAARARRYRACHSGADQALRERVQKDAKRRQSASRSASSAVGEMHDETAREMARGGARRLGRFARSPCRGLPGGVGEDQERGLGPHHQRVRELGAQAVGLRQALSLAGQGARHRHADRHGDRAWRSPIAATGRLDRRLPDRRRSDVRRRRALVRGQAQDAVPLRHAQQPRLLQRLGAPDHGRAPARHAGRARLYRHGHRRTRRPTSPRSRARMGWYAEGPIDKPGDIAARARSARSPK